MAVEETGGAWIEGAAAECGGSEGGVVVGKGREDGIEELDGKGGKGARHGGRTATGRRRRRRGCYIQEKGVGRLEVWPRGEGERTRVWRKGRRITR